MGANGSRHHILQQARAAGADRMDRSAAIGVAIIRLLALVALAGLLFAAFR